MEYLYSEGPLKYPTALSSVLLSKAFRIGSEFLARNHGHDFGAVRSGAKRAGPGAEGSSRRNEIGSFRVSRTKRGAAQRIGKVARSCGPLRQRGTRGYRAGRERVFRAAHVSHGRKRTASGQ